MLKVMLKPNFWQNLLKPNFNAKVKLIHPWLIGGCLSLMHIDKYCYCTSLSLVGSDQYLHLYPLWCDLVSKISRAYWSWTMFMWACCQGCCQKYDFKQVNDLFCLIHKLLCRYAALFTIPAYYVLVSEMKSTKI